MVWKKIKKTRFFDKPVAESILEELKQNKTATIKEVTKKTKKEQPPLLYDLTELQKDANRKFKFSAEQTLKLAQDLYEKHKVLTYPRTSSRYLSKDLVPKLPETCSKILAGTDDYKELANEIIENKKAS